MKKKSLLLKFFFIFQFFVFCIGSLPYSAASYAMEREKTDSDRIMHIPKLQLRKLILDEENACKKMQDNEENNKRKHEQKKLIKTKITNLEIMRKKQEEENIIDKNTKSLIQEMKKQKKTIVEVLKKIEEEGDECYIHRVQSFANKLNFFEHLYNQSRPSEPNRGTQLSEPDGKCDKKNESCQLVRVPYKQQIEFNNLHHKEEKINLEMENINVEVGKQTKLYNETLALIQEQESMISGKEIKDLNNDDMEKAQSSQIKSINIKLRKEPRLCNRTLVSNHKQKLVAIGEEIKRLNKDLGDIDNKIQMLDEEFDKYYLELYKSVAERYQLFESLYDQGSECEKMTIKVARMLTGHLRMYQDLRRLRRGILSTSDFRDFMQGDDPNPESMESLLLNTVNDAKGWKLDVSGITIDREAALAIASALYHRPTLTSLSFEKNNINNKEIQTICSALKSNNSLLTLNWYDELTNSQVAIICNALQGNTTLTKLGFSSSQIGDDGAKAVASFLLTKTSVYELELSGDKISDKGCYALLNPLQESMALKKLRLLVQDIDNSQIKALAEIFYGKLIADKVNKIEYEIELTTIEKTDKQQRRFKRYLRRLYKGDGAQSLELDNETLMSK